jgi:peptidoglycan L-alanyl-D-glutamate endopeptidase CwlK
METLKEGAGGGAVVELQQRLYTLGFPPGAIDGAFGPATEAAVIAFQRSEDLLPDGIVGRKTARALGIAEADLPPSPAMPGITVAIVSKMFPATHLDPIKANLPHVLKALVDDELTAVPMVLAALATIRAETEGFVPISEFCSRFNTSPGGQPFDLYDNRKDLGNQGPPDGVQFKGRGFVQLTGRANYTEFGPIVGVDDLVDRPDRANEPDVAARILAAFIKSKETAIASALAANDLPAARKLVNGGSHGLAQFCSAYETGLGLIGPQA